MLGATALIVIPMIPSLLIPVAPALAALQVWSPDEQVSAIVRPLTALAVAFLVHRVVRGTPWPRPFRLRFVGIHVAAAAAAVLAWMVTSRVLESVILRRPVTDRFWETSVLFGVIGYLVVTGVSYFVEATTRAARAEALAARTQLAALRAQIHPHFLFNALHAVVQLIPVQPARAAEAAELVADLLRTAIEDQRDEVTLGEEWRFVSRYLDVERIRLGDRLVVRADIDEALLEERVPAFALQTLVENAVRHGAAPRVEPTEIAVAAARNASELTLTVRNSATASRPANGTGTGLSRLRERLSVLHGGAARLATRPADGAFEAVLVVPRRGGRNA